MGNSLKWIFVIPHNVFPVHLSMLLKCLTCCMTSFPWCQSWALQNYRWRPPS